MTRDDKIKFAMAFLAPLLFEKEHESPNEPVQITFPNSHRAVMQVGNGEPRTIVFGLPFRLHYALRNFVEYNLDVERKDWVRCVYEQYEDVDEDIVYDPELVPDHIYHSVRFCQELIEDYFK